jgi:uncharacterized membrane protein YeaQ/YmgE (transglycosylase-associated protein family)
VTLAFIISLLLGGLVIGALARLAVPGPDPMSIPMTIALGLSGSFVGGIVGKLVTGYWGGGIFAFLGAVGLLIAYRHFVQHRPLTGPRAHEPPR